MPNKIVVNANPQLQSNPAFWELFKEVFPAKIKKFNGAIAGVWPEYEDCAKISAEHNIPFLDIYYSTLLEARIKFTHGAAK